MKMKKLASLFAASALIVSGLTIPQSAVAASTFATPSDFITDVVEVSLTGITGSTMDTAISTMQSKITVSGDEIFYDGTSIGYWYSDESSTLYTNSSKTTKTIEASANGYTVDPDLLGTILTDVNDGLIETYAPSTDDWSKIIGKYDVTLGSVTIPADQWIKTEASADGTDPLGDGKSVNISNLSGITYPTPQRADFVNESLYILSYLVDNNGKLFLQNQIISVHGSNIYWNGWSDTLQSGTSGIAPQYKYNGNTETEAGVCQASQVPLIKAGLMQKGNGLYTRVYATDSTNSNVYGFGGNSNTLDSNAALYSIEDPSAQNACSLAEAKVYGIIYFTGAQAPSISSFTTFNTVHDEMFTSNSCSKTVTGNTILSKRLLKLSSLGADDVLTVSATGWAINDTTDIDSYIAQQQMVIAGDTANIDAVAEIEPLCFKVIVPTTLPVYIDAEGNVTTASNATIINKSNAAVKITDIDISAKPESGWTLVASNPSSERDANEFTFSTSLVIDTELIRNEELPFTYSTELSPMTRGADSLDLATVAVTVDWADI